MNSKTMVYTYPGLQQLSMKSKVCTPSSPMYIFPCNCFSVKVLQGMGRFIKPLKNVAGIIPCCIYSDHPATNVSATLVSTLTPFSAYVKPIKE